MSDRTYGPEEIHKLLERALELQAGSLSQGDEAGLSLAELEEVARASGIDPAFVARAAAEFEAPEASTTAASSTHVFAERTVAGNLTDAAWNDLVVELRRRFERADGSAEYRQERHGATHAWLYVDGDDVKTQVYVTPREGAVHLRLSQSVGSADPVIESLLWSGIATVILGSLGAALVDGILFSVLAYVLTFVLVFPVMYGLDRRWRNAKHRELERTADSLARLLESGGAAPEATLAETTAHERSPEAAKSRIDLNELSEPEASEQPPGERTGTRSRT